MTITFSSGGSGFDWNMVIALLATFSLIGSITFNIMTCVQNKAISNQNAEMHKHNKDIQDRQIKISLFDKRYEAITTILSFIADNTFLELDNFEKITTEKLKIELLFKDELRKDFITAYSQLYEFHFQNEPLPNYTIKYKDKLKEYELEKDINFAFGWHVSLCLGKMSSQIRIS